MGRTGDFLLRCSVFFGGMTVMAFGIVLCIQAGLGVGSWDVLHIGISLVTPMTIGIASVTVGLTIVIITAILDHRLPQLGCVINMIYIGICIDLILFAGWIPEFEHIVTRISMMLLGTAMLGFGSGMYVAVKWGAGPRDGLTLALSNRTGWSVRKVRTVMEVTVVIIGWLLGGPVFFGTLVAAFAIGPLMQLSLRQWEKWVDHLVGKGNEVENIDKRAVRLDCHDGFSRQLR